MSLITFDAATSRDILNMERTIVAGLYGEVFVWTMQVKHTWRTGDAIVRGHCAALIRKVCILAPYLPQANAACMDCARDAQDTFCLISHF